MTSQSSTPKPHPTLQQRLYQSVRHHVDEPLKAQHERAAESSVGARYRQAHSDATSWAAHDYEVYWDLARAVPFPDLGPGETR